MANKGGNTSGMRRFRKIVSVTVSFAALIAFVITAPGTLPGLVVGKTRSSNSALPSVGAAGTSMEGIRNKLKPEGPDLLITDNSVRRMEFTSRGLRYLPKKRAKLMSDQKFDFELKSISSGSLFYLADADRKNSPPVKEGNVVFYPRPLGITEVYQALDSGVEQLFILEQNLNPPGKNFLITGEVTTNLRAESPRLRSSRGITFYSGNAPVIRYGAAKVIDAMNRELRAELELEGNQLSIVIDSAWLRQAAYPVTVDPLIGPLVQISEARPHCSYPVMAVDTRQNRYLVAWEEHVGDDMEIMGQFIDDDGSPSAGRPRPFSISTNPAGEDFSPSVAFDPISERFLVVWEERAHAAAQSAVLDSNIKGRFVGERGTHVVGARTEPLLSISSARGLVEAPDVAVGAAVGDASRFLVVYLKTTGVGSEANVYGQMLNPDGSTCGDPILIGGPSGVEERFHPSVAFGAPEIAEYFSVVYRTSDHMLRMARLAPECGSSAEAELILDAEVSDGPPDQDAVRTDVRPTVAYNAVGEWWWVNWIDYSARLGTVLRWNKLPSFSLAGRDDLTTLLGPYRFVKGMSVTSSIQSQSPDLVVALAVAKTPSSGFKLLLFQLDYWATHFHTTFQPSSPSRAGLNDWYPVVRASCVRDDYFVVWQRGLSNGQTDIVGQSYATW